MMLSNLRDPTTSAIAVCISILSYSSSHPFTDCISICARSSAAFCISNNLSAELPRYISAVFLILSTVSPPNYIISALMRSKPATAYKAFVIA